MMEVFEDCFMLCATVVQNWENVILNQSLQIEKKTAICSFIYKWSVKVSKCVMTEADFTILF